jgi:hypothetical protein
VRENKRHDFHNELRNFYTRSFPILYATALFYFFRREHGYEFINLFKQTKTKLFLTISNNK